MFKAIASCISKEGKEISRSLIAKIAPVADGVKMDMIGGLPIFDREIEMYTRILPQMKTICELIGDEEDLAPRLLYHSNNPQIIVLEDIRKYGYEMQYKFYDFNNTVKVLKKLAKFHALSFYMNDNKYVYRTDLTKMPDSNHYNKDEINPPDFLNQDFFENVLRESENDKALKITQLKLVPGTKPGDHFASIMFKAIISYTSKEEGIKKDMLKDMPIFDREIDMYTKVLPEMMRVMESIGDKEVLAPRLIYHSTDPPTLIFEDITKLGYEMHNGFFDFTNTVLIIKKLAKFHAVSFYMNDNKYNHIDIAKRRGEILAIYHATLTEYLNRLGCLGKPPSLLELNMEVLKRGAMELLWAVGFLPFLCLDFTKIDMEAIVDPSPEVMETVENGKGPIQFNKDELTPPDFLNEEYFLNILRGVENDKALTITKFEMIPGTKPGDHFASIMFKAIVSYTSRGKVVSGRSLVVKTMPVEEGIKKEMFTEMPIFDREIDMYTKILPEMKRLMESIGDHEELAPRLLFHSTDPFVLIFEDITKFGYEMHAGFLDFDNTVKVALKLAKFHALSFYMNDNTNIVPNGDSNNHVNLVNGEKKEMKMDFFEMTTVPPEWLNREYLEKVFREYENDPTLHIFECEIAPAAKPGDNFASVVFRAKLKYTSKNKTEAISIIIKVRPFLEGFRKELLGNMPLFETEADMYQKILPEMQRLLSQTGDKDVIAPKMIYYNGEPEIIIFEDIAPKGYVMRHKPMNFENTKKLIQKLAKFHALSFYMYNEEKKELDEFKNGLITTKAPIDFFVQGYLNAVKCIKEWPGYEEIGEKMEKIGPHFLKKLRKSYIPNKPNDGFNVLNHGDFHIKNLLFINDENDDINEISFIDFQISVWCSPAIDLNYVLYVNASTETRDNHRDELIRIYHTKFCSFLEELGCLKKPPSLLELHIELLKNGFFEVLLSIQFMAMFYANFEEMAKEDLSDPNLMEKMTKKLYTESPMRPVLEKLIVQFLHKGYFEI
uniref:CHK kinase-like domain-containing protein n=1 Tax=Lutzomyia longipalpis TaxID=7200 RepID=A0A1B0C8D6_LUTLO